MKSRILTCITALSLSAVLATPVRLVAQGQNRQQPRYAVTDVGALGGTFSVANGINNRGWVAGTADLPGDTSVHAFLWQHGAKIDLGTLGGPNSNGQGLNEKGLVQGGADTSTLDPMGEDFCFFGTHLICVPYLWQNGATEALPTLGGNNGLAIATNSRGVVGGVAENSTLDSTCSAPEFQAEPVVWDKGGIHQLATAAGDPDGYVNRINGRGDAVGASGICWSSFNAFALHALLWRNGTVTDLGNLGGILYSEGKAINDRGQVIGSSDLPGDTNFWAFPFINNHAFLWQNGAITDLGTLPGDAASFASAINNQGQAVGSGSRAILWHGEGLTDLNTLVAGPPFSPLYLLSADDINDRGEIVGIGLAINGELHAFRAVPCDDNHADIEGCQDNAVSAAEELIQPMPIADSPDALKPRNPIFNGRRPEMLNKPGIRQFPGHNFPTPRTGPMQ